MSHSVYSFLHVTGCRVKLEAKTQNTDGFSCNLHLLTLELVNTLYHHTWYHNLEVKTGGKTLG